MNPTRTRYSNILTRPCIRSGGGYVCALALVYLASAWVVPVTGQEAPASPRLPVEARQFDFWVGHWNLTWPGGSGTNRISLALDSAVILEEFNGGASMALRGMSVSVYDRRAGAWKQTWVDNQGGYLDFVGGFNGQRMILQRSAVIKDDTVLQRMVWQNITADSLDWNWERSDDQGKSWKTLWPIHYVRRE